MDSQKHRGEHLRHGPEQDLKIVTMTFTTQGAPAWSHLYRRPVEEIAHSTHQKEIPHHVLDLMMAGGVG